mmetsp:Transcript_15358/g.58058  ORF Transcript_15358/g.58058 Transcript_15358/m.58058 type:complete len:341 (+) Transcript_15358:425-1447(+)
MGAPSTCPGTTPRPASCRSSRPSRCGAAPWPRRRATPPHRSPTHPRRPQWVSRPRRASIPSPAPSRPCPRPKALPPAPTPEHPQPRGGGWSRAAACSPASRRRSGPTAPPWRRGTPPTGAPARTAPPRPHLQPGARAGTPRWQSRPALPARRPPPAPCRWEPRVPCRPSTLPARSAPRSASEQSWRRPRSPLQRRRPRARRRPWAPPQRLGLPPPSARRGPAAPRVRVRARWAAALPAVATQRPFSRGATRPTSGPVSARTSSPPSSSSSGLTWAGSPPAELALCACSQRRCLPSPRPWIPATPTCPSRAGSSWLATTVLKGSGACAAATRSRRFFAGST